MEVDGAMPGDASEDGEGPSQAATAGGGGGTGLADLDFSGLKPQHKQLRSKKEREALDRQLKEVGAGMLFSIPTLCKGWLVRCSVRSWTWNVAA